MNIFRRRKKEKPVEDKKDEKFEKLLHDRVIYLKEEFEYYQQCDAYHLYVLVEIFSGRTEGDLVTLIMEEATRHAKSKREMKDELLDWRKTLADRYSEEYIKKFDAAYARADEIFQQDQEGYFEEGENDEIKT